MVSKAFSSEVGEQVLDGAPVARRSAGRDDDLGGRRREELDLVLARALDAPVLLEGGGDDVFEGTLERAASSHQTSKEETTCFGADGRIRTRVDPLRRRSTIQWSPALR